MEKKYSHFSFEKRLRLKELLSKGIQKAEIADSLGIHIATLYREVKRGLINGAYDPEYAEAQSQANIGKKGRTPILSTNKKLAAFIADKILNDHLSPEQISLLLKETATEHEQVNVNTIYTAIDKGYIPGVSRETLRPKTVTVFSGGQVILPTWIRQECGIKDGDQLAVHVAKDGTISLKKGANTPLPIGKF